MSDQENQVNQETPETPTTQPQRTVTAQTVLLSAVETCPIKRCLQSK